MSGAPWLNSRPDSRGTSTRTGTRSGTSTSATEAARRCALLNGLAMSTKAWYGFLPLLIAEYDVLLYDYLGQGKSSKPDEPYSITRIAQYLTTDDGRAGHREDPLDGDLVRRLHRHRARPPVLAAAAHADAVRDHPVARGAVRAVRGDLAALLSRGPRDASTSTPSTCTRRSSASRSSPGDTRAASSRCGSASTTATRTTSTA